MDLTEVLAPVRDLGAATNAAATSLGAFIRDQRLAAQISVRQLAKKADISNPYLSQVERGLRRPSAEILAQIAHGLQISVESLLTMAGILTEPDEARAPQLAVLAAIQADPLLTDRQKTSLAEIYGSFRRETEADRTALTEAAAASPAAPPVAPLTDTRTEQGEPDVVPV